MRAHDDTVRATLGKVRRNDGSFASFSILQGDDNNTIVIVTFTSAYTQENLNTFFQDFDNILNVPAEFILVLDVHLLGLPPSLSYVLEMIQFLRQNRNRLKDRVQWSMMLLPDNTPLLESMLDIIFSLVPPQKPFFKLKYGEFMLPA